MAAYFQLLDKKTGEAVIFNKLDEDMCRFWNMPVDADKYFMGWYDAIGFRAAIGKSFADIRKEFMGYTQEDNNKYVEYYLNLIEILDYIEERYDLNSWSGR